MAGRHDLAPVCKFTGTSEPVPTPGPPSNYQKLDYGDAACLEGLEIASESECSLAIAALGITDGGDPWTGSRTTMPKGFLCRKQPVRWFSTREKVGWGATTWLQFAN